MSDDKDWFDARRRRDEGINRVGVNNHDWLIEAIKIVDRHAPRKGTFMAEEFREYPGIGEPAHPNAWGALTNRLIKSEIIEPTGQYRQAQGKRNHAHEYKVYRRVAPYKRPEIPLKAIPWTA
jgi:hypothetical protein